MKNFRKDIVNAIVPYALEDQRIILLVCDMGFGVTDNFKKQMPDRIFNVGIMEQGTIGIAAGLALEGFIPIVYSIVNFLCFRALEQIRNDIVLQNVNVKLIATGVNNYFHFLGPSHYCGEEDKFLMKLIGMPVFDPYEPHAAPFEDLVKQWITSPQHGYIRV